MDTNQIPQVPDFAQPITSAASSVPPSVPPTPTKTSLFTKKNIGLFVAILIAIAIPVTSYFLYQNQNPTKTDASGGQTTSDQICLNDYTRRSCARKETCITRPNGQRVCKTFNWGTCKGDGSDVCNLSPSCRAVWTGPCSCSWYDQHPNDCSQGSFSCNEQNPTCYKECTQEAPNPFATGDLSCDTEETGIRCACAGDRNPPPSPRPQTPVPTSPQTKSVCVSPNKCVDVATAVKMGCIDATATSTVGKMCSLGSATNVGGEGICCEVKEPTPTPTIPERPTPTMTPIPTTVITLTLTPSPTPAQCVYPKINVEVECLTCGGQ